MKDDHIGTADKPREDYDLIKVTMIRRGNNKKITEPKFKYLKSMYEADIDEILFQLFIRKRGEMQMASMLINYYMITLDDNRESRRLKTIRVVLPPVRAVGV